MKASTKKYLNAEMGRVHEVFQTLDKYNPRLADSIANLRSITLPSSGELQPIIPAKYKELIMTAVEVATGRGEKGKSHARKAVRAGANAREVQETLALCIYLIGMSSWVDGGRDCVLAAEDEEKKVRRGVKFEWTAETTSKKAK